MPFTEAHGILLRDGTIIDIEFPGSKATEPMGINDDGVIVGRYADERGSTRGFIAIPE